MTKERLAYKPEIKFMKIALREAKKGEGRTSPNPVVGAVIEKGGRILAKGYHKACGLPHAEIEALKNLNGYAPGATLYVTLEPCNHHGRTPPCTEAIIKSGIKKVVIGMKDPNPHVIGGGADFLRRQGIDVVEGVLEEECRQINEHYIKFIRTGLPYVMIKVAMTLDGWIATKTGHSKWITNEKSRQFAHRLRNIADAVLVGIRTIMVDNPMLTTRLKNRKGRDPVRVIIDPTLKIKKDANVLMNAPSRTIIVVGRGVISETKLKRFKEETGVSIIESPLRDGEIDLRYVLSFLGKKNIMCLLVEGGARTIGSFIRERLVDKFYIFLAPKLIGGSDAVPMAYGVGVEKIDEAINIRHIKIRRFIDDLLIEGYPVFN